jgi:hypothetical protein
MFGNDPPKRRAATMSVVTADISVIAEKLRYPEKSWCEIATDRAVNPRDSGHTCYRRSP